MTQTETRFITIFDAHIGGELVETKNGWKIKSAHDEKLLNRIVKFATDFDPDVIILGGDQLNLDDISRYNKATKVDKRPGTIKKAFEDCDRLLLDPLTFYTAAEIWWLDGNHEARLNALIAETPAIQGLLNYPKETSRVKHFSRGSIVNLGKLHFIHGDTIKGGGGKHPAVAVMNKYHCNIRCGHFHTWDVAVENSWVDASQYKTAIVTPCARNRRPGFMHNSPNRHLQGFGYGFVTKKGNFNDFVVIDNNGFTVEGKRYE